MARFILMAVIIIFITIMLFLLPKEKAHWKKTPLKKLKENLKWLKIITIVISTLGIYVSITLIFKTL